MSVQSKYYNLEQIILSQLIQWDSNYIFALDSNLTGQKFQNDLTKIKLIKAQDAKALVGMALGYCQASLKPSVVILDDMHNLIDSYSTLELACQNNLPLIVIYFSQTKSWIFANEVNNALGNICKLTIKANYLDEIAMCLKQAYNLSHNMPKLPVFIEVDKSVLSQSISELQIFDSSLINSFNPPSLSFVKKISKALFEADNPIAIIGDQVNFCGARKELESFAQVINIPVYGEETCCNVNFSSNNEFFLGHLQDDINTLAKTIEAHDVILLFGLQNINANLITTLYKFAKHKTIIQINLFYDKNLSQIPSSICLIGDIGETMVKIQSEIQVLFNQDWLAKAKSRKNEIINQNLALLQNIKNKNDGARSIELIMSTISQLKPAKSSMVCSQNLKIHHYSICFDWTNSSAYFSLKNSQPGIELSQALGVRLAAKTSQAVIVVSPIESITELINSYIILNNLNLDIKYIFLTAANSCDYSRYLDLFKIRTISQNDNLESYLSEFFNDNNGTPKFINIAYSK